LLDDAADHGYTNDTIQTALYEAYSCIFDIVTGDQPHPIVQLFHAHMAQEQTKFHKANHNRTLTHSAVLRVASQFPFSVPILPGDASLAVDFMASLLYHVGEQFLDECAIECIGQALFNLVILRTYLDRPPENDLDIFEAVKDGRISRVWTTHEQALAACYGEEDTSPDAVFSITPNPDLCGVRVVQDVDLELVEDRPLVAIRQPINWTKRSGLAGGNLRPRRYRPPYLCPTEPGPRPKPRPAYGRQPIGDNHSSTDIVLFEAKRLSNKMVVDEQHGLEGDQMPADEEPFHGAPEGLRRGTRKRKTVIF
jgi:hypothetical protein